jgi:hypothetical protein
MKEKLNGDAMVRGRVRIHDVIGTALWMPQSDWRKNLVLFDWAGSVGKLLTEGAINFKIGGMYLEYENVADPDDVVPAPTFDRSGGLSYYEGLSVSPTKDYLRVPLTAATLTSSDAEQFPDGNVMTFFAMSQGVVGVHGKAFDDVNNSKVYGGALVVFVDEADSSRDIVFSRFYFDGGDQQVKLPSSQIGLEWEQELQ